MKLTLPKLSKALPPKQLKVLERALKKTHRLDYYPGSVIAGLQVAMDICITHIEGLASQGVPSCSHIEGLFRILELVEEITLKEDAKQEEQRMQKAEKDPKAKALEKKASAMVSKLLRGEGSH